MAEETFENCLNEMKEAEKNFPEDLKESDSLGKGPDKGPEIKGKGPDLANVNEEDDWVDEEMDAYGRPNFPNPTDEELEEEEDPHGEGSPWRMIDGIINQDLLQKAQGVIQELAADLLEAGYDFEPKDILDYLTGQFEVDIENQVEIMRSAAEGDVDVEANRGEEEIVDKDECLEPPMPPRR